MILNFPSNKKVVWNYTLSVSPLEMLVAIKPIALEGNIDRQI